MKPSCLWTALLLACAGCSGSGSQTGDLATDQSISSSTWVSLDLSTGRVASVVESVDPGDARWLGGSLLLLRQIEPGTTKTGRPIADPLAEEDEYPRRASSHGRVWIATHELTQAQWRQLAGSEPWFAVLPVANLDAFVGDHLPAIGITPMMAENACEGMRLEGWTLSLPEAVEWELACTTGRNRRFTWGDGISDPAASNHAICDAASPQPVGSTLGNSWGMFDMHGNAWEIVRGDYGWEARGGGWDQPMLTARSSNRMQLAHDSTGWSVGLRLALRR